MTTIERKLAVGVFTTFEQAKQAVQNLRDAGFSDQTISFISRDQGTNTAETGNESKTFEAEGMVAGLTTGASVGALWGLGVVAGVMPVIGPAIAAGTWAAILSSAAAGAAVAGITGTFIGMGISRDESDFYESEVKQGNVVISVDAGERNEEALRLMYHSGAYNYKTRTQKVAEV